MKIALTLVLVLFVLQTLASVELKKNFQVDEKLFETLLAQKTESIDIQTFLSKMEQFPIVTDFPDRPVNYTQCHEIRVIGKTCVEIYYEQRTTRVGVRLIIRDRIVLDQFIEAKVCVDEVTLLRLISLLPPLLPFKPVIEGIIKLYGFIPANIFSICVQMKNLHVTRKEVSGHIFVNSKVMCIRNNCLQRGERDYGKFKITIPFKK
jgi:hypothetical protein